MAISTDLCQIIKNSGYSWTILDGIANSDNWPNDYIQKSDSGLITFFRDSIISNMISFAKIDADGFVNKISKMHSEKPIKDHYIITAQDAETFGHHIKFYETKFLGKTFSLIEDRDDIKMCFVSDLVDLFPVQKSKKAIKASSWSTTSSDIASRVPYPLWASPLNPVHKYQYRMLKALNKLMSIVENNFKLNGKNPEFQNYYRTARYFYDQSMHSCWLWWASMRPMWSPNLIYKGVDLIMKAALNAQLALINLKVGAGDEDYGIIMDNIEKLMTEIIDQEAAGQKVRTYGDF
jgi:alpha-amylase/alpha-mannosidase (GH57 family)